MKLFKALLSILLCALTYTSYAQQIDSAVNQIQHFPDNYYSKVDEKLNSINARLTKKSLKYLAKFQRHEKKLQQKLGNINTDVKKTFENSTETYTRFRQGITSKTTALTGERMAYNSYIDTLATSLSFLKKIGTTPNATKSIESLNNFQGKFQESEKITQFISERKQQIKELLSQYTKLPAGLSKEYAKLNKTAYYYSAQVKEYKDMLKDPSKVEQKAIALLTKLPEFQKFMQKNSQLASLFPVPNNYGTSQSLAGLQSRASIQALVQQRVAAGGPNAQQIIQQNIAQAQGELMKLKDKLNKFGGGTNGPEIPSFKPNTQKTKAFLKRLEYGANVQFTKSSNVFPSTTNIGLSLGYKVSNNSIIGIGLSYKIGMGSIRHISISHQGIGLRSFVDYKIKKSLYASGGYEMNYNAQFKKVEELKKFNGWQTSGLIGISKKYKVSKKVKGEMKLLYDILANTHQPVTQPVIFRVGYNF